FQEAYGLAKEIKYADGEGKALTEMCLFYLNKGEVPRAKELGENAIETLNDSTDKKALAEAEVALAQAYFAQDNAYLAMRQLELALKCFSELQGADSAQAGEVLVLAAGAAVKLGFTKEALQFLE